jgi:carbon-monoxide dehydrogenase medium subunit
MKAAPFDYVRPKTIAEAAASLALDGASTAAIAGGQSLVPMLNLRVALPDLLVDLAALQELKETGVAASGIRIGALTTHAEIEDGKVADLFDGLMPRVAAGISYRAIRNYGTIGGSVALADPAADWPVCLLALGAVVHVAGRNGARVQPVGDFVHGPFATSLAKDEIIVGFDIPRPAAPLRWGSFKVVRKSGAFASSIAVAVGARNGGPVSVALGAAGPRPFLLRATAARVSAAETSEDVLCAAITEDLAAGAPDADAYLLRLHTATVLRAVREMRSR